MTARRYFALVADSAAALQSWKAEAGSSYCENPEFERHDLRDRVTVIAAPGLSIGIGRTGLLLGTVCQRGGDRPLAEFASPTRLAIHEAQGRRLVEDFWGSFVALLVDAPDRVEIVRSPLGDLPCYFVHTRFGVALSSDVEMLSRFAGFVPRIDWSAMVEHLAAADLRRRATCLKGLSELMGGERLRCGGRPLETGTIWNPWVWTEPHRRLAARDKAAACVGDAVRLAVRARAASHGAILLRLSGGLDSSIVAACLAAAGHRFTAMTLATTDRGGDERIHARAVARAFGVSLIEARRDAALVDLTRSEAAGLPRPSAHAFAQATSAICARIAEAQPVDAVFDGGGGDNVFASLQSTAPVADCLKADGGLGHFWRTARSIGIVARTSTIAVARRAVVRSLTRRPGYRWPLDLRLMTGDAVALAAGAATHPWLTPPSGTLPGSAAHMALIAAAQSVVHSPDPRRTPPHVSPLIAQPVVEACLRVPGWLWTRDGRNRAVARDAFRPLLPAAIVDRRDKGAMDSFLFELIEANSGLVRAMLLDGALVAHGLLDRSALARVLDPGSLVKGHTYMRLMQLVDAESWLASWG